MSTSGRAVCALFLLTGLGAQTTDAVKTLYQTRCASCHGEDGRGGEHGPAIVARNTLRATTKEAVRDIIRKGIPNAGMPAFEIPESELDSIAAYVMALRKAAASTHYAAVSVRLHDGKTIQGTVLNENAFDIQVLDRDGKLHLVSKDATAEIKREKSDRTPAPALTAGLPFDDVAHPKPGSWPTYHGNVSGNRFSPLSQIDTTNVTRLVPKWMFQIPVASRALQVTPLVVDGVMYVTAANEAYALDARRGREVWHYSRPRTKGMAGDAASGINRGAAILGDRIFMVTDNAHLIALHRFTGQLLWDVEMADYRQNYGSTSAPLVVDDLVISGVSGGDEGVRGFVGGYKASTGERVWRFWTVPAPGEPGSETWGGRAIEHGCATTWLTGTYDPASKILYWPTGNPCPDYNGDERKGDNLYSDSVLALDPQTGTLKWYYQFTPHDLHDWDATETPVLIDAQFHGRPRKLLLHGNRNGYFYVLDRLTGEVLLAEPFVKNLTWSSGIGAGGRPKLLPGNDPTIEGQLVCPNVAGAANWPSNAYSPATGLFYMFAEESCTVYSKNDKWWEAGKSFYGGGTRRAPDESEGGKFLKAIDIRTGKTAWEIPDIGGGILGSGLMVTAGGLVFYGDGSGTFIAAGAKNGKLLWHFNTGQSSKAGPMTYTVDGTQYVAIAAGSTILAFSLR